MLNIPESVRKARKEYNTRNKDKINLKRRENYAIKHPLKLIEVKPPLGLKLIEEAMRKNGRKV